MTSFNSTEEIRPFEFDGYRVRLASGTSIFSGNDEKERQGEIWRELEEENYHLIGNKLFTITTSRKRPDVLSGIAPRLHIELTLQFPEQWIEKDHVVLIFDNDNMSLVDWVVASPAMPDSDLFLPNERNEASLYFDIPLVPVSRYAQQETLPDGPSSFLDRLSQWQEHQQLTFGIFSFNAEEYHHSLIREIRYKLWRYWPNVPPYWPSIFFHRNFHHLVNDTINAVASRIDEVLKHNTSGEEQLQVVLDDGNTRPATPQDLQAMQGKALLLCHGILSSTQGAFSGILNDTVFMSHLCGRYGRNMLAWDHYTLSKTTAQNASDLLSKLGSLQKIDLDVICHSRGAGVTRNFIENPQNRFQLAQQNINADSIVFVAGACLGSQLADAKNTNRLFRRLNMLYWFFGGSPVGFTKAMLIALKLLATIAQKMPGVEAMNPIGQEIAMLNVYGDTAAKKYCYIRANYDVHISLLPLKLIEELLWDSAVFEGVANDLIVPYEGASSSDKYLRNFLGKHDGLHYGSLTQGQSIVWHINFFTQNMTKNELRNLLP